MLTWPSRLRDQSSSRSGAVEHIALVHISWPSKYLWCDMCILNKKLVIVLEVSLTLSFCAAEPRVKHQHGSFYLQYTCSFPTGCLESITTLVYSFRALCARYLAFSLGSQLVFSSELLSWMLRKVSVYPTFSPAPSFQPNSLTHIPMLSKYVYT
jgi:hypothetical protein